MHSDTGGPGQTSADQRARDAGVAHDFNNMLTAIKGYSQLLLDGLGPEDPLRPLAEQIGRAAEQASTPVKALSPLTPREQQILALIANGMTNDKTASELGISPETVQSHVRNAMAKLKADTRTQAVATAFRRSLLV